MADRNSPLTPLGNPVFRTIWSANLVSNFGGQIQAVGAAWLMTSLTASVDMIALVQTSTTLPLMMFSLLGGAIADTFDRRTVMIGAQIFMLLVSLTLTVMAFLGLLTPWLLLGFTFLVGCGVALNNPTWQASIGDIVPRSDLPGAVALNSVGFNLSRSLGPALGGLIVAAAGATAAFAVNTLSYAGLITVLFRWRPERPVSALPRETMAQALLAGLRYVGMSPHIMTVLLRAVIYGFSVISVLALLPAVSTTLVGGGPAVYGLLLGAFGIGAVGGAFLGTRLHTVLPGEVVVRLAFLGFAICATVTALSSNGVLTGMALLLGGACWVLALSLLNVTVQLSSPRWVVGRTLSLYQTSSFAGMALGSWLWGVVGEHFGLQVALIASAACMLGGIALGFVLPLPPRVQNNLDPLNRWKEPNLELDLQPRSGPIVISLEYNVAPSDVPAFLAAMADRRRIRIRNGAGHWALMRDLEHPDLWTESYTCATWTEYVRHQHRTTLADAEISERLRGLHRGSEPPRITRRIERPPNWFAAVERQNIIEPH